MSLNLSAANRYNQSRNYSAPLIRVIRREVGSQEVGELGSITSSAIYTWQGNQRSPQLTQDGMFGPRSLGVLIRSLEDAGRSEEATLARQFPHHDFDESSSSEDGILEFRALRVRPITLERLGRGWICKGKFRVIIRFHEDVDATRYEYRQFIKGTASTQPGRFTATPPSMQNWVSTGALTDAASAFQVPGGLSATIFREDGFVRRNGSVDRYGYRSNAASLETNTAPEDRYLPNQAHGRTYRCTDAPGLADDRGRPAGLRIRQKFLFQGRIIDTARGNRIVATRHWKLEGDHIIV
ncbi:MAG: hypothetical protein KDB00_22955 [Planctomycetales bacterium]|nr:hypothetical protein [Planctomycetales bacterium]